jgi:uncharacterized repeat protein (TIGR01451 family)
VEVGEGIHFKIILQNIGNTIAINARVTDVFPTVLDIVDAETSVGTLTINSSTKTVTVSLGSFAPGQSVTISISTKVNSSATANASYDHNSVLTFSPNVTIDSNTVRFQVVVGTTGTLPGTGFGPGWAHPLTLSQSSSILLLDLAVLVFLAVFGWRWSSRRVE